MGGSEAGASRTTTTRIKEKAATFGGTAFYFKRKPRATGFSTMIYLSPTTLNVRDFNAEEAKEVGGGSFQIGKTSTTFKFQGIVDDVFWKLWTRARPEMIAAGYRVRKVSGQLCVFYSQPAKQYFISGGKHHAKPAEEIQRNHSRRTSRQPPRQSKSRSQRRALYGAAHRTLWSSREASSSILIPKVGGADQQHSH
jgi:hypothetical protein